MSWQPISEAQIWDKLNDAWQRMSVSQRRVWEVIRIDPEKWSQQPYGAVGNGFWAVGVVGRLVLWFNDIEDGFNISRYETYGAIAEYLCNQDELEFAVHRLQAILESGGDLGPALGPPIPGAYRP